MNRDSAGVSEARTLSRGEDSPYPSPSAMRLWSLHPRYLDPAGLVALWREGLLAQAVLADRTRGYRNHPQLDRFRAHERPRAAIAAYLHAVADEARERGYRFDRSKLPRRPHGCNMTVTRGQLRYEWDHLMRKLELRNHGWHDSVAAVTKPQAHPMFLIVSGSVEPWERLSRS